MSVIPVSVDKNASFSNVIQYISQWLFDINSTSSYVKVKEFSQASFFLGGGDVSL